MNCPKCGKQMPEGALYCENCGEEIQVVPNYEPELESHIERTMDQVMEHVYSSGSPDTSASTNPIHSFHKPMIWILLAVLTIFLSAVCLFVISRINHPIDNNNHKEITDYIDRQMYSEAESLIEEQMELTPEDQELHFLLAEIYFEQNKKDDYETQLLLVVRSNNATDEQLDRAYGKLLASYCARRDSQAVRELLNNCTNRSILDAYGYYLPAKPEFDLQEGFYSEIKPVKLSCVSDNCTIYYTTDSTSPDEHATIYTAPILLESGTYTVSAIAVNELGISSEIVQKHYTIDLVQLDSPRILPTSGQYLWPQIISVEGDTSNLYYAEGGKLTDANKIPYTGALHMPEGKSTYQFAYIQDGMIGNITTREYQLTFDTEYSPAMAVSDLVSFLLEKGILTDSSGHFNDSQDRYRFYYQYPLRVDNATDCYIIAEGIETQDGSVNMTDIVYAVDIYNHTIYQLQQNTLKQNVLIEIK